MPFDSNWDFPNSVPTALDKIHPYPAKFIREIPQKLLTELKPDKKLWIYDPFCGSGTTLTVAQELGYKALGVDLNPIACLISRVKTHTVNLENFKVNALLNIAQSCLDYNERVDIKNINHWFMPHVISEISCLRKAILNIPEASTRDVLNLCLSSIIVRVSNQDSDTRYAAVNKDIPKRATFSLFINAYKKIYNALNSRSYQLSPVHIFSHNALDFKKESLYGKVGMVITSPPYPNAYEYWLYHKYRMYWLGYDPEEVKRQEIGARAHFFKKNHHNENSFYNQMVILIQNLKNYLVNGSLACFVVGRSKIHGKLVDNADIIAKAGEVNKFKIVAKIDRNIQNTRKSFNLSHANIKKETLVILKYEY